MLTSCGSLGKTVSAFYGPGGGAVGGPNISCYSPLAAEEGATHPLPALPEIRFASLVPLLVWTHP